MPPQQPAQQPAQQQPAEPAQQQPAEQQPAQQPAQQQAQQPQRTPSIPGSFSSKAGKFSKLPTAYWDYKEAKAYVQKDGNKYVSGTFTKLEHSKGDHSPVGVVFKELAEVHLVHGVWWSFVLNARSAGACAATKAPVVRTKDIGGPLHSACPPKRVS